MSAWLLLSVFLPMLILSSLHVHDEAPASSRCSECINHIPHQGHISLGTVHIHDCLLCQLASLPFLAAVAVSLAVVSLGHVVALVQTSAKLSVASCPLHSPRAPPVFPE